MVVEKVSAKEDTASRSSSIAFAEQLFKAATGRAADPRVYSEFRDRLFTGPKRLFDFVEVAEDGKRLGKSALADLRRGIDKSRKVILLGKNVSEKIGRDQVPPEKRIEIPSPEHISDGREEGTLAHLLLVDPVVWEGIIRLALELAT
ncbi:TPA: hypothetical protein HA259_04905 [Thermoplasmata archaeon]|nr:hypothetical protein [Thermoplasmata archaeon]